MESIKSIKSKLKKFNDIENLKNQLKNKPYPSGDKKELNNILSNPNNNFAPKLRPKKIHLVPSKLRLNPNGSNTLKRNKNNQIFILSNKYFISCPNLEEEGNNNDFSSQEIFNRKKMYFLKLLRKKMTKIKKQNLARIKSKTVLKYNNKIYRKNMIFEQELSDDDNSWDKKEDDYFNNLYKFIPDDENEFNQVKNNNENNEVKYYRFNSCSILEVLKSKYSLKGIN